MKRLIAISIVLHISNVCFAQINRIPIPIYNSAKYKFIGRLGEEMGDTLTVRGFIVEGYYKSNERGPNLVVQMIRDSSIQELLQIPLSPFFLEFGTKLLPKIENNSTYSLRVYETGGYVGKPQPAMQEWGNIFQSSGFGFSNRLVVVSGKKIEPIEWSPIYFLGRNALLSGTAINENDTAVIQTSKCKLKLIGSPKWTNSEMGKLAEVYGLIRETKTEGVYDVENCQHRLVSLKDQLGKTVKLRGTAWSMNGYWWFNYRGTDMYVEKMDELPGWKTEDHHGRPIEITGILEQRELPRIDQITLKTNRDSQLYYIVRKASWISIEELLTPEVYH